MKRLNLLLSGMVVLVIIFAGCSNPTTQVNSPLTGGATVQPNHVEINYFFIYETDTSCGCYDLAKQWVESTLNNEYKTQLEKGELVYFSWDSQDPANADRVNEFHSPQMSIYVTVVNGTERSTHDIRSIWLYLDPTGTNETAKNKFIETLKKDLDKLLALIS